MRALDAGDILTLWERGARCHALDRSVLLCARAHPEWPADSIADRPLGHVTVALLRLRQASFGARIDSHVACRHCGARLQLVLDTDQLVQPEPAEGTAPDLAVRAPTLRDLAAVAHAADAARLLLARCMGGIAEDTLLHAAGDAIEALDPNADLALDVHCAVCGGASLAQLDAGILLWDEIDARARALLADVHTLASAYGWSESAILALAPVRRASYLAMVGA